MSTAAQLRFVPLPGHDSQIPNNRRLSSHIASFPILPSSFPSSSLRMYLLQPNLVHNFKCAFSGGNGGDGGAGRGSSGNGGGGGGGGGKDSRDDDSSPSWVGPVGSFINGWRSRVAADPQFPFQALVEELFGVTACKLIDMASCLNFGLDFVFSTMVVGSILNIVLFYLLAPSLSSFVGTTLPSISSSCPTVHMFEPGPFSIGDRFGTLICKGVLFAIVGFSGGLFVTTVSNGLIKVRKIMDPNFETPNKPPPTLLNAGTWALQMGLSSNLRYHILNGLEYVLWEFLPSVVFKRYVIVLRILNNVLGAVSFVVLARLTGSQSTGDGGNTLMVTDEVDDLHASEDFYKNDQVDKKSN